MSPPQEDPVRTYRVGETYRDTGRPGDPSDQFLGWLNADGSGIPNTGGVRPLKFGSLKAAVPCALVLVTRDTDGEFEKPWSDTIDVLHGRIDYWGDAKSHTTRRGIQDWKGNRWLLQARAAQLDGQLHLVPPILHFSKEHRGTVRFNGLCVLGELNLDRLGNARSRFWNLRARLLVLDAESVETAWIRARRQVRRYEELARIGPEVWTAYLRDGTVTQQGGSSG